MRIIRWICAVLLVVFSLGLFPAWGQEKREEESQGRIKEEKEFRKRVNRAVDQGMEYLLKTQNKDGSFPPMVQSGYLTGPTALALLALLASGQHPSSEPIRKGLDFLAKHIDAKNYEVALTIMAIEAKYVSREERLSYHEKKRIVCDRKLNEADRAWMAKLVDLLTYRTSDKAWSYPRSQPPDNSNSQYALLGLDAAFRCRSKDFKVQIPEEIWLNAIEHFLDAQEPSGPPGVLLKFSGEERFGYPKFKKERAEARGWGYQTRTPAGGAYGSMTAGGIASVIICKNALSQMKKISTELSRKADRSIRDGLAWLQENFSVTENPKRGKNGNQWHFYYLYGLERAGILAGTEYMGEHQWYREGAEFLLSNQCSNGMWDGPGGTSSLTDTCFALLFLKRSTIPTGVTPRVR